MGKVGFIGGGQMASALVSGACAAGVLDSSQIVFAEPSETQRKHLREQFAGCGTVTDAAELLADAACEQVILAVKPHILRNIAPELSTRLGKQLVVSIAAGISLGDLRQMLGTERVIRVMPNTPCQVGAGASAIASDDKNAPGDLDWVRTLMQSVGEVECVPDHLIHAFTGIAGSSPAYIYMVIEALSDGGVAEGLPRATATRMAAQAVLGAAKMVVETGEHPGALKDQVTSPGGTTIAAIRELEAAGVRSAMMEAVVRCSARSKELG